MKNFGKRLTKLREDRGLSLKDLANELKLTIICLDYWEKDKLTLSINNIIKMAKYFNVSVDYLLGL